MFGNQPLIHLFFLVTNIWSLICAGAPTSLVYVYRGDYRSPAEIQEAGGFLPKGQSAFGAIAPDISLFNHAKAALDDSSRDDYGYVFTSSSLVIAERIINMRPEGYIYKIHVTANMIDIIGTLGKHNPLNDEREYAALGGIKFEQIVSWKAYENGKSGEEELNKEFNEQVYSAAIAGGVQFQLAGFLENTRSCEEQPGKNGLLSKRRFGFGLGSLKSGFGALRSIKGVKSISNVFKSNPFKKGPKTSPLGSAPQAPVKSGPGRKMPDLDPTPAPPVNQGLPVDKSPMDNTPATKTPVVDKTPDDALGEKTPVDKTPVDKTPSQAAPSVKPHIDGTPGQQPGGMRQGPDDQVPAEGTNGRLGGVGGSGMPIAINPIPAAGFPMSPFPMTPFPSTPGTDTTMDSPVDRTPVDGTNADGTSTDGTLTDGTSADGTPTDGTTVDGTTPADGTPVPTTSTTPLGGTPVEDTPVQETPAHDVPTQKAPVTDTPVKDTPTKDTPTNDVPVKDTPVRETPAKAILGKDTPVLETPVSQLQARQAQTCASPKSAYEIAKAYLASVNT
ncbi:Heat-labile enterotoxin IIA, A chain [Colletotrichum aenigma]|uniref:Heat-labile enterotoxin IIA, A chain n=1 Tax=Colletotrichum aenigma TaxID=1215731 RepID=UPI001872AA0C|nr:Heat-labile enterotoxin IIA, A chain [Colletotrichum aenigma]KAF5521999.1 Heat-labile enterotoxin IIA, A chain [Colletotrichum aenigma]